MHYCSVTDYVLYGYTKASRFLENQSKKRPPGGVCHHFLIARWSISFQWLGFIYFVYWLVVGQNTSRQRYLSGLLGKNERLLYVH